MCDGKRITAREKELTEDVEYLEQRLHICKRLSPAIRLGGY